MGELMKFTRIKVGAVALALALVTAVGVTPVSAAKAKAPGRVLIVRVVAVKQTSKLSKVTVTVELPPANGSAITSTQVNGGNGYTCTIKGRGRSCTMYRVRSSVGVYISAQSRNKVGTGPRSSTVSLGPFNGRWLRAGYTPNGTKYPTRITMTANARVLQQGVQRWSKFQPIKQSGVTAASIRMAGLAQTNPPTVVFRTSGVVGLALPATGATGSGLLAVNRDGTVIDAVQTGTANVRDFYSAPNNKFYVVFNTAIPLYTGGPNCILAEVDADSGNPVCVDPQMTSVTTLFGMGLFYGMTGGNGPIQFDDAGNIYYVGVASQVGGPVSLTLRKRVNGVVSTLIADNIQIRDFVVLGNGSVLVSGSTSSTMTSWVRKVSPSGALTNISSTTTSTFMKKFADGNIYLGFNSSNLRGVRRFLAGSESMDPTWWIAGYGNTSSTYQTGAVCWNNDRTRYEGFCYGDGGFISAAFNVGTEKTIVVAGLRGQGGTTLMQYYPTVDPIVTSVRTVTLAQMVGRKLIVAGTTADEVNTLVVLDLDTYQETVLIDSSNQTEVYNMSYIAATNKIMFNGLRFADNTYVVGEVDLP